MQFDPNDLDQKTIYKLLTATVIPRPIGWISSISKTGISNLAPFSYFNVVGDDPPHIMFSAVSPSEYEKDTRRNILETKQFVANIVTEETVEKMNATAEHFPSEVDEFEKVGLTKLESVKVKPFRVGESPVNMECELVHHYNLENSKSGVATVFIGRVVQFHIADEILLPNTYINLDVFKPVARLAGTNYSKLGEIFSIKRN